VGATRYDENVTYYSNRGSALDIVAPGGDLNVDQNEDGYGDGVLQQTFGWFYGVGYYFYAGTSMATPHVAGVAALIISASGNPNRDFVRDVLQSTAEDHGATGWDTTYGWGIVDAGAALASLSSEPPTNQSPVANAGGPYSGIAGEPLSFDGSASSDSDGTIVSYDWDFGDGNTGSGESPSHTYGVAGTYTVTLTVTDDDGDQDSDTAPVTVGSPSQPTVKVDSIDYVLAGKNLKITVTLLDNLGGPVANATVTIVVGISFDANAQWDTWAKFSPLTGTTGDSGTVTFMLKKIPPGPYYFKTEVSNVDAGELYWDGVTPYNIFFPY